MKVLVVGAGVAGLSIAARLAYRGYTVEVIENSDKVGGKMFQYTNSEGLAWDTGPTLISLPDEIKRTFEEIDFPCPELLPLQENCHLVFSDGTEYKLPCGKENIISYFGKINPKYGLQFKKIMQAAGSIFEFASNSLFHSDPPSFFSIGIKSLKSAFIFKHSQIALSPYVSVVDSYLDDKNLREFFYHFSSYVGALPENAQGGILSIAHVELASEVVFPKGGVYNIAHSLYQACIKYGVTFHFNTKVTGAEYIQQLGSLKWKLTLKSEEEKSFRDADILISNCDPYVASQTWLSKLPIHKTFVSRLEQKKFMESESQFVMLYDWKDWSPISHHVKLFPKSFKKSFEDVYLRKLIPEDPCLYLVWPHATDKSVSPRVLFISAMAPNTMASIKWDDEMCAQYSKKILEICRSRLKLSFEGEVFKVVTPAELESRANGLKGGIYSANPTKFDAMHFYPSGLTELQNLFFVGAGVHPGAGVTMVMKSARRIFQHIDKKFPMKEVN